MSRCRTSIVLAAALLLAGSTRLRAQAEKEVAPDHFGRAKRAYDAGQYLIARKHFTEFVTGTLGDRRKDDAKQMLAGAFTKHAAQLQKVGFPLDAAAVWLDYAEYLKDAPEAESARKSAADLYQGAFDAAMKAKDYEQAVQVVAAHSKQMPDAAPLCTPDKLKDLRLEALVAAQQKRLPAELLHVRLEEAMKAGVAQEALTARKVNVHALRQAFVQGLVQQGQFARAIKLLEEWAPEAPAADKKQYESLLVRLLLERAELFASFGNVALFEKALNAAEANSAVAANKSKVAALRKKLDALKSKAPAAQQVLKIEAPLTGPSTWQDEGAGHKIEGKLTFQKAKIQVAPGFVLEGGSIFLDGDAHMELHGTPDKPVIFRDVRIDIALNASLKARSALFIDCKFNKAGGWFARYSSKWYLTDCLLVRSGWMHLSEVDFGVQAGGCAFVECKLPSRPLGGEEPQDKASKYRDQWNKFEDNAFLDCEVAPSFVWATKRCHFENCTLTGWENFRSTTDLDVAMNVPPGSERFFDALRVNTQAELNGGVRYTRAQNARRLSIPLWRFVDIEE